MSCRLSMIVLTALLPGLAAACSDTPVGGDEGLGRDLWDEVTAEARARAQAPYRAPENHVSRAVAALSYGQLRGISFRGEESLWADEGRFRLQLFHPGGGFETPVELHLVEGGEVRSLTFDPSRFRYGDEVEGMDLKLPPEAGHPGFRVLFPLNDAGRFDEVVSFLGASYFRLLGPDHVYGLSSRGLAVDVAEPGGEEFPDFVAFWLLKPAADAETLTFFGLLDGPSVAGAYRFQLTPGDPPSPSARESDGAVEADQPTVLAVEARLFAREDVGRLGVAPLTSMYLHGTFRPGGDDDFRPRVHDSQGLLMNTGKGEWIWRPLTNGSGIRSTSLRDVDPRGFGLAQRDRAFESYLDLEARYHRRPSQWVAVDGEAWGPGGVELLEFPTESEFNDNVVAYWRPDAPFRAGEERVYRYRLVTFDTRLAGGDLPGGSVEGQTLAQVIRTRIGWDGLPGQAAPPPRTRRRVVVDFAGGGLSNIPAGDSVTAVVQTSAGAVEGVQVLVLPDDGRRATFALRPEPGRGADLRVYLTHGDTAVTETWSYFWEAPRGA